VAERVRLRDIAPRVGQWAAASKVALAYVPTNASWHN
jgi:hypothetical protein